VDSVWRDYCFIGLGHYRIMEVYKMNEPIFDEVYSTHELYRVTARIEARKELAEELKQTQKPTKQLLEIIKRLETNAGNN
jgi:hypothetical protein